MLVRHPAVEKYSNCLTLLEPGFKLPAEGLRLKRLLKIPLSQGLFVLL